VRSISSGSGGGILACLIHIDVLLSSQWICRQSLFISTSLTVSQPVKQSKIVTCRIVSSDSFASSYSR